jgi:hypothetical protein
MYFLTTSKSMRMWWAEYTGKQDEIKCCNIYVGRFEWKSSFGRTKNSWQDSVIYSGFAWFKHGFWILLSNLLNLYTTRYNIPQINIFDWSLSTSDHVTLIHYSKWIELNSLLLLASRYIASGRTSRKTRPLLSNGCLPLSRIVRIT